MKYIFKFRFKENDFYFIFQENLESVDEIDADEVILTPELISANIDITDRQAHISKSFIVKLV